MNPEVTLSILMLMGNYSAREDDVRVDFFKPSGKWYATESLRWPPGGYDGDLHEAFRALLWCPEMRLENGQQRYQGMTAVCLEPYHRHSHPLMVVVGS